MGRLCISDQLDTAACTGFDGDRTILAQDLCGLLHCRYFMEKEYTIKGDKSMKIFLL